MPLIDRSSAKFAKIPSQDKNTLKDTIVQYTQKKNRSSAIFAEKPSQDPTIYANTARFMFRDNANFTIANTAFGVSTFSANRFRQMPLLGG